MNDGQNILSRLRVIDCGTYIAGPAAATIMSDFGAEVIKIERPPYGDPYRRLSFFPGMPISEHNYCWTLDARHVPDDVVGRLDCAILEREFYPLLGLSHEHITDPAYFDYYPETSLDEMQAAVDSGRYDVAIALHPAGVDELLAVADAGLEDPRVMMPEKSTFFTPKLLTGLFLYRHRQAGGADDTLPKVTP